MLRRHADGFDPRDLAGGRRPAGGDGGRPGRRRARPSRGSRIAPGGPRLRRRRLPGHPESPSLSLGVSPRGATALLATSRAWAWLSGRDYVTPDDVKALARPALRHRVQLRPEAELEGVTVDAVLDGVLASVPVPR